MPAAKGSRPSPYADTEAAVWYVTHTGEVILRHDPPNPDGKAGLILHVSNDAATTATWLAQIRSGEVPTVSSSQAEIDAMPETLLPSQTETTTET
jgi:hypothetical protein